MERGELDGVKNADCAILHMGQPGFGANRDMRKCWLIYISKSIQLPNRRLSAYMSIIYLRDTLLGL